MSRTLSVAAAFLCLSGCATTTDRAEVGAAAPACRLAEADQAWLDRAVDAWRFTSREITAIGGVPNFQAVFFDGACVLTSANALSNVSVGEVEWIAAPHDGVVRLPDGDEMPAGVTSFTSGNDEGLTFFVMSTPSVWRAAGVDGGPMALENLMVAVMLHEGSHVAQIGPYGARLGALIEENDLPESFTDDSLQHRFRDEPEFAASIARETELLTAAAAAADDAEARRLAREARALMRARSARWFVGEDAFFEEAENIWLTFEGSGQWAGYQWLVHPQGGAAAADAVNARFVHNRWWSQTQGFALAMAVDRIVGPGWKSHAFGDGAATLLEMLDAALAETEQGAR